MMVFGGQSASACEKPRIINMNVERCMVNFNKTNQCSQFIETLQGDLMNAASQTNNPLVMTLSTAL